jgi:hypothetical protein
MLLIISVVIIAYITKSYVLFGCAGLLFLYKLPDFIGAYSSNKYKKVIYTSKSKKSKKRVNTYDLKYLLMDPYYYDDLKKAFAKDNVDRAISIVKDAMFSNQYNRKESYFTMKFKSNTKSYQLISQGYDISVKSK